MRTLTFEQITDTRFENGDIEQILAERIDKICEMLNRMEGVHFFHFGIKKITFENENNSQCRCQFWVKKDSRKTTWNDIFKTINSIKAVPYRFVEYDWKDINE